MAAVMSVVHFRVLSVRPRVLTVRWVLWLSIRAVIVCALWGIRLVSFLVVRGRRASRVRVVRRLTVWLLLLLFAVEVSNVLEARLSRAENQAKSHLRRIVSLLRLSTVLLRRVGAVLASVSRTATIKVLLVPRWPSVSVGIIRHSEMQSLSITEYDQPQLAQKINEGRAAGNAVFRGKAPSTAQRVVRIEGPGT